MRFAASLWAHSRVFIGAFPRSLAQRVFTGTVLAMALTAGVLTLGVSSTAYANTDPVVRLQTNLGAIDITLNAAKAPKTVANFIEYVQAGFYEGTIFHRVIGNFMIQGGGYDAGMNRKGTNAPIQNEADNALSNVRGTIAMARTSDPHSATAQFFINVVDNPALDFTRKSHRGWGYTVYGSVTAGMDVVDAIRAVETTSRGYFQNLPVETVVIESAQVIEP